METRRKTETRVKTSSGRIPCTKAGAQYEVEFDPEHGALWGFFHPTGNPCFSLELLREVREHDQRLERECGHVEIDGVRHPVFYYVVGSRAPRVFNLGGDLALFRRLIEARDAAGLGDYARLCIDNVYPRIHHHFCPCLTTISLVQGDALGGGFETVLLNDVTIAEKSAKLGLPEVLFNMFPGMGAYSLLARRLGRRAAEDVILGGDVLPAVDWQRIGLVDMVVEDGWGEQAVREWIAKRQRRRNAFQALSGVGRTVHPITREELDRIADIWVTAALRLEDRDLRMMDRLVQTQLRRHEHDQRELEASQSETISWTSEHGIGAIAGLGSA